jgi:hypothetical protein
LPATQPGLRLSRCARGRGVGGERLDQLRPARRCGAAAWRREQPAVPSGIDEGLARLRAELGRLAATDLDDLCDALLNRLVDGRADDDIALLAVHVRADG